MDSLNHGPSLEDLVNGLPDKKEDVLTIDKCIDYLSKHKNSINVEQHFKLIAVVRKRNIELFKGNKKINKQDKG